MSTVVDYQEQLTNIKRELADLEVALQSNEVLKNADKYRSTSKKYTEIKEVESILAELVNAQKQLADNRELETSESDAELLGMLKLEQEELAAKVLQLVDKYEELVIAKDPLDDGNAIIEIRAGAGGEEAALFAQQLYRAYGKFAEANGFKPELANLSYSSTGGFKEVIFFIQGNGAYKFFKYESGVHRVQRVPVTESSGRIHTSTASVVVLPESPDIEVDIKDEDLRIDVYRAGGPGGQSVNTTDSAVRIVHIPSGIVVTCQDEKSQLKNKAKALKILQAKLYDIAKKEAEAKMGALRQSAIRGGDRSAKIRTYNFPQSRITDHRIHKSWHNLTEVMEGNFSEIVHDLAMAVRSELKGEVFTGGDEDED